VRIAGILVGAFAAACGGSEPLIVVPEEPAAVPTFEEHPDCKNQIAGQTMHPVEKVSGFWVGRVEIASEVRVPLGATLHVCPGTVIAASEGSKIIVDGTIEFAGESSMRIQFEDADWEGIEVSGSLESEHTAFAGADVCIRGLEGSRLHLSSSTFLCGQAFRVKNGATLDHVFIQGGLGIYAEGGMVTMRDSKIDLSHPGLPPDCTYWLGGGGDIDHVHFTGCHTPLHVLRAPDGFIATNSIFDGSSLPIVISDTHGALHGNHILFGAPQLLDGGGNLSLDVSGNYWGDHAPRIATSQPQQFTGLDDYSLTPLEGVGPHW
jgi:hypothetical protein